MGKAGSFQRSVRYKRPCRRSCAFRHSFPVLLHITPTHGDDNRSLIQVTFKSKLVKGLLLPYSSLPSHQVIIRIKQQLTNTRNGNNRCREKQYTARIKPNRSRGVGYDIISDLQKGKYFGYCCSDCRLENQFSEDESDEASVTTNRSEGLSITPTNNSFNQNMSNNETASAFKTIFGLCDYVRSSPIPGNIKTHTKPFFPNSYAQTIPISDDTGILSYYEVPESLKTPLSHFDALWRQRSNTAAAFLPAIGALMSFGGCSKFGGSRWLQCDLRSIFVHGQLLEKTSKEKSITMKPKGDEMLVRQESNANNQFLYPDELSTLTSNSNVNCYHRTSEMHNEARSRSLMANIKVGLWAHVPFSSSLPTPVRRHRHTLTTLSANEIFLFGGCTAIEYFNDVWLLTTTDAKLQWTCLLPSETNNTFRPCPRSNHRAAPWQFPSDLRTRLDPEMNSKTRCSALKEKDINKNDDRFNHMTLTQSAKAYYTPHGTRPLVFNHSAENCPTVEEEYSLSLGFLVFGGLAKGGKRCWDCWLLDVEHLSWYELPMTGLPGCLKDPVMGIWRNNIYLCGMFRLTDEMDHKHSLVKAKNGCGDQLHSHSNYTLENDSYVSVYQFNTKDLKWQIWGPENRRQRLMKWIPNSSVVVGSSWLLLTRPTNQFPIFFIFNFITATWMQLDFSGNQNLVKFHIALNNPYTNQFKRQSDASQLLFVSDNNKDAVIVLNGLAHPILLRHPELSRSLKWERCRYLIWLQWLADNGLWKNSSSIGASWRHVFENMPQDILRNLLDFL